MPDRRSEAEESKGASERPKRRVLRSENGGRTDLHTLISRPEASVIQSTDRG